MDAGARRGIEGVFVREICYFFAMVIFAMLRSEIEYL